MFMSDDLMRPDSSPEDYRKCWLASTWLVAFLVALAVAGCSVSKSMRVRSGEDPTHKDEDVRFRTTYYFRVFDACEGINEMQETDPRSDTVLEGKKGGPYHLKADSLYRFRMT